MIIAINTRFLLKNRIEGIGRFSYEILKRITQNHKEHTFIFLFDRKYDDSFIFSDNIIPVILFPPARHPFLWYWYFEFSIPKALKKHKVDLFITTDGWLSTKTKIKTLQVLHDLHYENHPEFLPYFTRKYYQYFFPKFTRKSTRIVTVSEFCKKEICNKYSISESKIDVVHNSTRNEYVPLTSSEIKEIKKQYTNQEPYLLVIGPIHPRKNIDTAINAFLQYKKRTNRSVKLVITGSVMWKNFGSLHNYENNLFFKDIIFTGYLNPEELKKVTGAADCLLYVSFYEGFGLPILEAMSSNVPVITSNISAMPEVAGDAALLIDPNSVETITNAIEKIQSDYVFRNNLIQKGKNNLLRFSWDKSAEIFWESILKTLN